MKYIKQLLFLCSLIAFLSFSAKGTTLQPIKPFQDNFNTGNFHGWKTYGTGWLVVNGQLINPSSANIFYAGATYNDFTYEADVSVSEREQTAGLLFRATMNSDLAFSGYYVDLLNSPGRVRLELRCVDHKGSKVLSDAQVLGVVPNNLNHIKVVCKGAYIWVFFNDMLKPVLSEYDTTYSSGYVGFRSEKSKSGFDNAKVYAIKQTPKMPMVKDWSYIKGAVYTASNSVNATQTLEEFSPVVVNRELSYAKTYGFNTIVIYLHWLLWDKYHEKFLNNFDQFLQIADKNGLKVSAILFDPDCGDSTAPHLAPYDLPTPGIHNSQMNRNPGADIKDNHYQEYKSRLKEYTLAVVNAHKSDPRIIFWQACNEPLRGASSEQLTNDATGWIKTTGTTIPVVSTGSGFFGPKYSDFYTFHMYGADSGDEGGAEHLCTECLNRPAQNFLKLYDNFAAKRTGFIIWDLMIGRDNCRFPWGSPLNAPEPAIPFHGFIYPDGHPWSVEEAKKLKGSNFDLLPLFKVEYFSGVFETSKKISVTPLIDFDLGNERGTGSPDASAGIPIDNFSIRWVGKIRSSVTGIHIFYAKSDNIAGIWINGQKIVDKSNKALGEVSAKIILQANETYDIKVEYQHGTGDSDLHISWAGPNFNKVILSPVK